MGFAHETQNAERGRVWPGRYVCGSSLPRTSTLRDAIARAGPLPKEWPQSLSNLSLNGNKFSAADAKEAGLIVSAADAKRAGFSATDLKRAGFSATDLKQAGFSLTDLKRAGFSAADLKEAGFSAADLKEAGFSAADIFPLCKDERREGAQGVFHRSGIRSEFGTLYKEPDGIGWRPNGPNGNLYWDHQCRVLEW